MVYAMGSSEYILKTFFSLYFDRNKELTMKILIKVGFMVWSGNHCGCRKIIDARRHKIRRRVAYNAAMVLRAALIAAGY